MSVLLRETGSPLKQGEFWAPNALQKSDFDCQRSVSLERVAFRGREALVCSAGAKGELRMSTSWQDSHTLEQKLSLFWPAVELQSIGTDRASDSVLNSFAENGSQLWYMKSVCSQLVCLCLTKRRNSKSENTNSTEDGFDSSSTGRIRDVHGLKLFLQLQIFSSTATYFPIVRTERQFWGFAARLPCTNTHTHTHDFKKKTERNDTKNHTHTRTLTQVSAKGK